MNARTPLTFPLSRGGEVTIRKDCLAGARLHAGVVMGPSWSTFAILVNGAEICVYYGVDTGPESEMGARSAYASLLNIVPHE